MRRKPKDPRIETAYKTAVFKIHNPSKRKRVMLDDCLYRYHLAFEKALKAVFAEINTLEGLNSKDQKARIKSIATGIVNALPLATGSKSGVLKDIDASIRSYLELTKDYKKSIEGKTNEEITKMGGIPGKPTVPRLDLGIDTWAEVLQPFLYEMSLEEEASARDEMAREQKRGNLRPVQFTRNRISDGFLLLWNDQTNRYYIYLNLHQSQSRHGKKNQLSIDGLIDLNTGEVIKKKTALGALFPVEFGRKHQANRFVDLSKMSGSPRLAKPESAKLVKRGNDYEIHVSFAHEAWKIIPNENQYLGIDRGIHNLCSLVMIDDIGRIVEEKNIDGMALRHIQRLHELRQRKVQQKGRRYRSKTRLAESDKAVHTAANAIVTMAVDHQAQVVLEWLGNLTNRSKKRGRSNFNRMINRQQFSKLHSVLEYKLAVSGLPKAITVAAGYTSMTCPECGHCAKENRDRADPKNRFICQSCGYEHDADLNAAHIIALKKYWRAELPKEMQAKKFDNLKNTSYSFQRFLKRLAKKRNALS